VAGAMEAVKKDIEVCIGKTVNEKVLERQQWGLKSKDTFID